MRSTLLALLLFLTTVAEAQSSGQPSEALWKWAWTDKDADYYVAKEVVPSRKGNIVQALAVVPGGQWGKPVPVVIDCKEGTMIGLDITGSDTTFKGPEYATPGSGSAALLIAACYGLNEWALAGVGATTRAEVQVVRLRDTVVVTWARFTDKKGETSTTLYAVDCNQHALQELFQARVNETLLDSAWELPIPGTLLQAAVEAACMIRMQQMGRVASSQ